MMKARTVSFLAATAVGLALATPAVAQDVAEGEVQKLDTLVVSAAGFEQNIMDAPASISVISAEDLKDKAYRNITDALRDVAGVSIEGSGVNQSVSIRGMDPTLTLFLIDGRPVSGTEAFDLRRGAAVGGNSVNLLPPLEAIEQIEVIRGPASALYGSDAIGGIVNIITRKVNNEWSASATAGLTLTDNFLSENNWQGSFAINAPLLKDRLSLQVTGGYQHNDESDYVGDNTYPKYEQFNIGTKFSLRLDEHNHVTLGNTYVQADRERHAGRSLAPDDVAGETDNSRSVRQGYFLTHEGKYDNLLWSSYANYDVSENRTSEITNKVLVLNSQATRTFSGFLGSHTLTGGVNYKDETLKNGLVNDFSADVVLKRWNLAGFLEDQWALADGLTVTLSGRYDHNENFGGHFSPKVYGHYYVTPNLVLKGGVTSGFRVPKMADAAPDYGFGSNGGLRLGNPNLKPEESLNKEIGLVYNNKDMGLNASVTVYETDYKNKIARTGNIPCPVGTECVINGITYPGRTGGYTTNINLEEAETKGIEHTLDYKILPNLRYSHNYTYLKTEYTVGAQGEGVPLRDNPEHMFNASLHWQPIKTFTLWSRLFYRSKSSGNQGSVRGNASGIFDPDSIHKAYTFYDVGMDYSLNANIRFNFGVYNITNKLIATEDGYSSTLDGRRFTIGATAKF